MFVTKISFYQIKGHSDQEMMPFLADNKMMFAFPLVHTHSDVQGDCFIIEYCVMHQM